MYSKNKPYMGHNMHKEQKTNSNEMWNLSETVSVDPTPNVLVFKMMRNIVD